MNFDPSAQYVRHAVSAVRLRVLSPSNRGQLRTIAEKLNENMNLLFNELMQSAGRNLKCRLSGYCCD